MTGLLNINNAMIRSLKICLLCLCLASLGLVRFDCAMLCSFDNALKTFLSSSLLASSSVEHLSVQRPVCIRLHLAGTLCVTFSALSSLKPASYQASFSSYSGTIEQGEWHLAIREK